MPDDFRMSSHQIVFFVLILCSPMAAADVSPLCEDLARFACAPGTFKDGTGEIKSDAETAKFTAAYTEKIRARLREKFSQTLDNDDNPYFKDVASAALGLKDAPQCTSTAPEDAAACRENLVEGLTTIAQHLALGPLVAKTGLERPGNLKDLNYVVTNSTFKKIVNELNQRVRVDLGRPELTQKIQDSIFPRVRDLLIARVQRMSIPEQTKTSMMRKIKSISFEGSSCEELGRGSGTAVASLLVPNAFYEPGKEIFKFCSGFLLQADSEFTIAWIIGHELAHSIDPCNINRAPANLGFSYSNEQDFKKMEREYPVPNVIDCLRGEDSVGARNSDVAARDDEHSASSGPLFRFRAAVVDNARNASFCHDDQIGESFSDWLGVEMLPKYMEQHHKLTPDQFRTGYGNAMRLFCKIEGDAAAQSTFGMDVHPDPEKRINRILLTNPDVRRQMGCPPKHSKFKYCDTEAPAGPPKVDGSNAPKTNLPPGVSQ